MFISAFVHTSVGGTSTYVSPYIGRCIRMDRDMGTNLGMRRGFCSIISKGWLRDNKSIVGVTASCYKASLTDRLAAVDPKGPPEILSMRTV